MSKQSPSERQAELERAAKYNACPDCKRPTARTGAYICCAIRGSETCVRIERDNLRVEVAALCERKQLEAAVVEAAVRIIEDWRAGVNDGHEQVQLATSVNALLAHRQRNNDGNR